MFMGVPTMYNYLLSAYDAMSEEEKVSARDAASRLRLTVSGSAACPIPIMERWEALSGASWMPCRFRSVQYARTPLQHCHSQD